MPDALIAILPERVRNQIAAGEVVEPPASVVKELVENALDAGARAIDVDLEAGGTRLVRVADDGSGMGREDVALAFVAHATSKLRDVEDLDHIASLGFRGEALASIGAVARCALVAREAAAPAGWRIECNGGELSPVREAGAPRGTRIEVRDLFFNVPARRRFLRQESTELARCLDVLQRLALAHSAAGDGGVAFRVTHDGARVLDVEGGLDLRARVRRLFGADLADALAPVAAADGATRLVGLVAPPRFARGDTSRQMWFLNGRSVRDRVLLRALKDAYHGFVFDHRQPVAFLHLALDPSQVDVNVHPQKSEVRFRDERRVFPFLVAALRAAVRTTDMATPGAALVERALRREDLAPALPFRGAAAPAWPGAVRETVTVHAVGGREAGEAWALPESSGSAPGAAAAPPPPGAVLQIAATYLVRAVEGGFEIVDQHALHERITYEALRAELARGAIEVQRQLVPELVEVGRAAAAAIGARAADLARAGILVEPFGEGTVAVHGLPARLARPRAAALVRDIVALLEEERALTAERLLEEVLHRAACRASVMAGDTLSPAEMQGLLERGAHLESDQTCVHGRPTRVRFTLADLERAFNRR